MALTQSARLHGPSWDEEVVPALRKRLESESRTLSRRMSAISLSSTEEQSSNFATQLYTIPAEDTSSRPRVQQLNPSDRPMPSPPSRVSGAHSSTKPAVSSFQRSRTYSQPFTSDIPSNLVSSQQIPRKSTDPIRSLSSRPTDIKPTRIPKASRGPPSGSHANGNVPQAPYLNGYTSTYNTNHFQPTNHYLVPDPPRKSLNGTTSNSSRHVIEIPTQPIVNERPPFPTSSSVTSSMNGHDETVETPPRQSNDSEERPYEHWYRGEVSRNGGVGELKVGRRQEMLEIANYGYMIKNRNKAGRTQGADTVDDFQHRRKRADSIAGITNKERERGSLYLDEEHAAQVSRVLDENPLTDLDGEGEGSEVESASEYYMAYGGDDDTPTRAEDYSDPHAQQQFYDARSTTPTPLTVQKTPTQKSAQPTRIPGPSSRRSSVSHPAPNNTTRGQSEPPSFPSASQSSSSHPLPSSSSRPQPHTISTAQKRSAAPAKTSRTTASKATRAKTTAARKELENEQKRGSIAQYPTPDDESDMADAIPSWTQPVPRSGNWDEVVLPVVARKKGLNGHYETADGNSQPKKVENPIEPAPGTFGYDHSKYRPPRDHAENIPMDEFGKPSQPIEEEESDSHSRPFRDTTQTAHDKIQLPERVPPPPSPAPFSHYAPDKMYIVQPPGQGRLITGREPVKQEEDDKGAGCCKCIIM